MQTYRHLLQIYSYSYINAYIIIIMVKLYSV